MQIVPTDARLGAEVRGVDAGSDIPEADQASLRDALNKHRVLLLRGQNLVPVDKHIRFARVFGPLGAIADTLIGMGKREYQPDEIPECVSVISNIKKDNGEAIGSLGDGECFWHNDSNFADLPPEACILHSIEIPSEGGNTAFLDMVDALESLPADMRARIEGRNIRHSKVYTSGGEERPQYAGSYDVTSHPGPEHPIVINVAGGKQAMFLGRRKGAYVVGLPAEESEELLDALWEHTVKDQRVWSHSWQLGDVVIWHNRMTMHHRDPFDPNARRRMHKVQVGGERPA